LPDASNPMLSILIWIPMLTICVCTCLVGSKRYRRMTNLSHRCSASKVYPVVEVHRDGLRSSPVVLYNVKP